MNSPMFRIVMSIVPFDRDLKDIGLPLTDSKSVVLLVINPSNAKSSGDLAGNSLS